MKKRVTRLNINRDPIDFTVDELNEYIKNEGIDVEEARRKFKRYSDMTISEILIEKGLIKRKEVTKEFSKKQFGDFTFGQSSITPRSFVNFHKQKKLDPEDINNIDNDFDLLNVAYELIIK